uniref:Uncharacterized protein n=1 Tax=Amphimedon queenslandica TaxID=400682 RepID=A0A1X7VSG6_AMPQE
MQGNQSPQHSLASFLLNYRTTAHAVCGVPPVELFLKRCLKTCLDLVKPDIATAVANQLLSQKNHERHSQKWEFSAGDLVMFKLMLVAYNVVTLIRLEGRKRYRRMLHEQRIKALTQPQKERLQMAITSHTFRTNGKNSSQLLSLQWSKLFLYKLSQVACKLTPE